MPIYTSALALTPINYLASLSKGKHGVEGEQPPVAQQQLTQSTHLKTAAKHIFLLGREKNSSLPSAQWSSEAELGMKLYGKLLD